MGALLSVFLSLFVKPSAIGARNAAGGGDATEGTAPTVATATGADVDPSAAHKAESAPEAVTNVRAAALQAEAEIEKEFADLQKEYDEWRLKKPEPRIKDCRLSDADRAKLLEHLERIFDEETLDGRRVAFAPYDVVYLISLVFPILESEPMLIDDVPFDITVVGDLHGQLHDLHRVFEAEERDGKPGWENMKYLFLGNYITRGRQGLEILMCLFSLKCLYPDRIFLLRGKEEFLSVNAHHGFPTEMWDRYEEEMSYFLYNQLNAIFCYLSVVAILGNKYMCAHSGIALSGWTRRVWRYIRKPYNNAKDDVVVYDTIWSGPALGIRGSYFNADHLATRYSADLLATALHAMECKLLIRSHSALETGYEFLYNLCISVTTATGLSDKGNNGALAVIDANGKMRMSILLVDRERIEWEKKLKRMDANHFEDTDDEGESAPPAVGPETGAIKAE